MNSWRKPARCYPFAASGSLQGEVAVLMGHPRGEGRPLFRTGDWHACGWGEMRVRVRGVALGKYLELCARRVLVVVGAGRRVGLLSGLVLWWCSRASGWSPSSSRR